MAWVEPTNIEKQIANAKDRQGNAAMKDGPTYVIKILLVEDNPGDVILTREAFKNCELKNNIRVATDGEKALQMLLQLAPYEQQPLPDLILLDLNLPKKDGRELLDDIKDNDRLKQIPIIVLTSSNADTDILKTYKLHTNNYIVKPVNLASLTQIVSVIEQSWLSAVALPARPA